MVMILYNWNDGPSSISYSYFRNLLEGKDANGKVITDDDGTPIGCMVEHLKYSKSRGGAKGVFKMIPDAEPRYEGGKLIQPKADLKLKKEFWVDLPGDDISLGKVKDLSLIHI